VLALADAALASKRVANSCWDGVQLSLF
jgi:hypothetical protein